ncbi:hypothetical protein [Limnobaculum xujianqingii]|uniref:hypothetical protein n=1 Tax=Limnobaculum xujianqingii TaxID=2738837 RepID=UPI0011267110|nr:hypothetical protein [Limnobaculum xujianqingii]
MKIIYGLAISALLYSSTLLAYELDIIPGVSVGPVTSLTSEADLIALLGKEQVKREKIELPENDKMEVTVLFPGNSEKELQIFWNTPFITPGSVQIIGTVWKTPEGIHPGISLKEMEQINQSSFRLSGYEWDEDGAVTSYGKGVLSKYTNMLFIRFNDYDAYGRISNAELATIMSDSEDFSSNNDVLQKMNPSIKEMFINFNKPGSAGYVYIPNVLGEWKIIDGVCGKVCTMDNAQISTYKGKIIQITQGSYLSPFVNLNSCGLSYYYEIEPFVEWLDNNPYITSLNLKTDTIAVNNFSCLNDSVRFISLDDNKTAVIGWEGVHFKLQMQ